MLRGIHVDRVRARLVTRIEGDEERVVALVGRRGAVGPRQERVRAAQIGLELEVALLRERPQDRVVHVPRRVARVREDPVDPDPRAGNRGVLRGPVLRRAVREEDIDGVGIEPCGGELTGLV